MRRNLDYSDDVSPTADDRRQLAILAAAVDLITDRGWNGLAMRTVAERAGVSLTTIYDRWPTKADLALAAIQSVTLNQEWSLEAIRELFERRPNLVLCLVSIQRAEPSRRAAIDEQFEQILVAPLRQAAIDTSGGELDVETANILALLGPAFLFVRNVVFERPVSTNEFNTLAKLIERIARSYGTDQSPPG